MNRPFSLGLFAAFSLLPVTSVYAASIFTSKPVTTVSENQIYQYNIQTRAQSTEGSKISIIKAPKGMELTAENNLIWKPSFDDAGSYDIVLSATDGEATEQQQFTLIVQDKNRAPVITSKPITRVNENQLFEYPIQAVDADGDKLQFELLDMPKGMQISDNQLTWQTNFKSAGIYPVHVRVRDKQTYVDQTFVLTVSDVNRLPEFTAVDEAALNAQENEAWQLTLAASDADDDKVTLSLNNAPEGLTLKNNTLYWKPDFKQAGKHNFDVIASDSKDKTVLPLVVNVKNLNRLPAFTSQPVTTVAEPELYQYNVRAFDPDEEALKFSVIDGPKGMVFNEKNQLIWQTSYDDAGSYPVTIAVTDGEASIQQSFTVVVANTNRAPVIHSTPIVKIKEAESFNYTFSADDPDQDNITISYIKVPAVVTREDNQFSWKTDYKSAGDYAFHIRVSDGQASVDQQFTLTVENVNHAPVFTSKPILTAIEAVDYQYDLSATDADDEALSFSLVQAPTGMRLSNNQVLWKPNFEQEGKHDIVIAVTDGIDTVTQAFTIKVANTNREPSLLDIDDQTVYAGDTFQYALQVSDVDNDKVSAKIVHGPSGMKINKHFQLSWKTKEKDIGEQIIIVEVSDGDLKTRKHFTLEIVKKPEEPKQ